MLTSKLSFVFNYQVILRTNIRRVRTGSDQFTDQSRDKHNKPRFSEVQRKFPKDTDKERKRNKSVSETTSKWKAPLKWNKGYGYKLKQLGSSSVNKVQKWKTSISDKLEKERLSFSREFRNINDESIRKLKQVRERYWAKPLTWNIWWRSLFKKEQDRTRTKPDEQDGVKNKYSRWDKTKYLSKFAFKSFVHIWTGATSTKQRRSDTLHMEIPQFELMFHNSEKVLDMAFENHIKSLNSDIREVRVDVIFKDEISSSNENDMIESCHSDMKVVYIPGQTKLREYPGNIKSKPMNEYESKTMQEVPVVSFHEDQRLIKSCIIPVNEYETKQKIDALLRGARITISVSTESSGKIRKKKGWFQKVVEVVRERKNRTLGIAYESTTQRSSSHCEERFNQDVNLKQALQAKQDQIASEINKIVKDEVQKQMQRIKARDTRELDIYGEQQGGLKCESVRQVRNDVRWNQKDNEEVLNNILRRLFDDPEVRSLFTEVKWKMLTDKTVHFLKKVVEWLIKYLLYTYLFPSFIDAWNANSWTIDTKIAETTAKTTITTNIISDTPNEKVSEKPDINP